MNAIPNWTPTRDSVMVGPFLQVSPSQDKVDTCWCLSSLSAPLTSGSLDRWLAQLRSNENQGKLSSYKNPKDSALGQNNGLGTNNVGLELACYSACISWPVVYIVLFYLPPPPLWVGPCSTIGCLSWDSVQKARYVIVGLKDFF